MSQDSLGKKTHLPNVLRVFAYSDLIWPGEEPLDLREAVRRLGKNPQVDSLFRREGLSFDPRARQAYVKRFFRWLELPTERRRIYPTRLLATGDSIALRQCLYLDFVFNTSEAPHAIAGLNVALRRTDTANSTFVLSPDTHREFCRWIGVSPSDNTRRGPFARWLEDAALAAPFSERAKNETSVVVGLNDSQVVTPEALAYGLFLEFCSPFEGAVAKPRQVTMAQIQGSRTAAALLLQPSAIGDLVSLAAQRAYLTRSGSVVGLDPEKFSQGLRKQIPLPSPAWISDDPITIDDPVDPKAVAALIGLPADECTALGGEPFDSEADFATKEVKQRIRVRAFQDRVAAAYHFTCAISGSQFRSPFRRDFYGEAAHIVPHQGRDVSGAKVYGKPDVANGIFLDRFWHWCFDRGWFTLVPEIKKGAIQTYRVSLSTLAADVGFGNELSRLEPYDNLRLPQDRLPADPSRWPSVKALEWHRQNVFADCRV